MIFRNTLIKIFLILVLFFTAVQCNKNSTTQDVNVIQDTGYETQKYKTQKYKTQNVIIVVVDGPRYNETWGEPSHKYIPKRYAMLKQGVLCSKLYNNGTTSTVPDILQ